jgi:hypothetical protein
MLWREGHRAPFDPGTQAGGEVDCRRNVQLVSFPRMGCPPQRAGKNPFEAIGAWCRCYPSCALTLLTVAALAPFLAKPFNIDDPLFVWAAQHTFPLKRLVRLRSCASGGFLAV